MTRNNYSFTEGASVKGKGVNDTILLIYSIRIVSDKMNICNYFFVNLFDMDKGKNFFR
jgi:hypothetical protein